MSRETTIAEPRITDKAIQYHVLGAALGVSVFIVTIPLLIIIVPLANWYYRLYFGRMRITLTNRSLKVLRGIISTEEKTIPLDKITDMAIYQGPLMRWMGIKGVRVETAGQTSESGALVTLIGLENPEQFRDHALNQRDAVVDGDVAAGDHSASTARGEPASDARSSVQSPEQVSDPSSDRAVLTDIRDTLQRIEQHLADRASAPPHEPSRSKS